MSPRYDVPRRGWHHFCDIFDQWLKSNQQQQNQVSPNKEHFTKLTSTLQYWQGNKRWRLRNCHGWRRLRWTNNQMQCGILDSILEQTKDICGKNWWNRNKDYSLVQVSNANFSVLKIFTMVTNYTHTHTHTHTHNWITVQFLLYSRN